MFFGLCLAVVLLPLLAMTTAHRFGPSGWTQAFSAMVAWLWLMSAMVVMGLLVAAGHVWRTGAGALHEMKARVSGYASRPRARPMAVLITA